MTTRTFVGGMCSRWLRWWCGAVVVVTLTACSQTHRTKTSQTSAPKETVRPTPVKPAPAPPQAPMTPQPAPAPSPPPAAPSPPAKPAEPAPAAPQKGASQPEQTPPKITWPEQGDQPMSDADQEALAQMIRAAVEEAQKRPPTPAIASSAIAQPAVPAQPATTTQPTSQPAKAGCGAAGGPPIDLTPPPVDQPQPKLVCQQKKVAAENVWQGKTAEFAFTIANEGEAPLAIRIKPGWGVKINGQSDRLISPGQSDSVVISMSTGPRRGKLQRTITVQSNDRENPSVGLECEAEILSALKCDPETVNLGTIKRTEERVEKTVKITRGSAGPIQPKIASTGSPQVTAELREIEPGENYELDIVAQPPWPNGMLRANLQVQTGIEQAPTESITVFGNVVARAQASPQRFMIRPDKKEANLVARLNWDDNNPGRITAVTVSDPKLTADVEEQEQQQIIVLHVPPDYSTPTGRTTQVNVQTDDPAVPVLQIPVFVLAGTSGATAPPAGAARPAESPAARRARLSPAPSPPVPVATPVGPSPSPSSAPAEDAEAK